MSVIEHPVRARSDGSESLLMQWETIPSPRRESATHAKCVAALANSG